MLKILNLSIYKKNNNSILLENVDFFVHSGKTTGLFGGSGSGKTIFSLFILGLINKKTFSVSGEKAFFKHKNFSFDLFSKSDLDWLYFRKNYISLIFQDPSASLNPNMKCGKQIMEGVSKSENIISACYSLLKEVEIKDYKRVFDSYPHELSGGQKQRVVIAIALASNPKILIADEPTTSLDPIIQKSILILIEKLKKTRKIGVILISHNLTLIKRFCDSIYFINKSSINRLAEFGDKNNYFNKIKNILTKIKNKKLQNNSFVLKKNNKENLFYIKPGIILETIDLSLNYNKNNLRKLVLKNINIKLRVGEIIGLIGPSGCGKTSLGRILAGLNKNFSGKYNFPKNCSFLKKGIQMVYQDPFSSFNPKITIKQSISEIINTYKTNFSFNDLFSLVELDIKYLKSYPHELSGGQKQRVSIARALASNPSVLIFDESLSGLDLSTQYSLLNMIFNLKKILNISVVFISHDVNNIFYLCDNIYVLNNGEIIDNFKGKYLYKKTRSNFVKNFIRDYNFKIL